jgi:hypothetical protein
MNASLLLEASQSTKSFRLKFDLKISMASIFAFLRGL